MVRNRVKRRIREALRPILASLPAGWDVVIIGRSGAADAPFAALASELEIAVRRLGLASRSAGSTPASDAPAKA